MARPHDWTAENSATVKLKLHEFSEKVAKRAVLKRLRMIASRMVTYIDDRFHKDSKAYPEWTANLHDATGVAIYADGRLDKFLPTKRATSPQVGIDGGDEWGRTELEFAISQMSGYFSKGLWLVVFSASSYADHVDDSGSPKERGKDFFTSLWEVLSIDIQDEFNTSIVSVSGLSQFF